MRKKEKWFTWWAAAAIAGAQGIMHVGGYHGQDFLVACCWIMVVSTCEALSKQPRVKDCTCLACSLLRKDQPDQSPD